jgi:tryptophan synthase beta subunit
LKVHLINNLPTRTITAIGGAFIPEMLYSNVEELRSRYLDILSGISFREFELLLKDYASRLRHYILLSA